MEVVRVLQVFTIMDRGGSESMIMNYYRQIDRNQVQFDFLVHRKEKADFDEEIKSLGGTIYRMDPINPLFPKSYYQALRNFFKEHPMYDIVHAHLNTFSYFPLKIAEEFGIPCRIAHAHIAMEPITFRSLISQKEGPKDIIKQLIKLQLKKRIHKHTTHFFSCGQKAGEWLFGNEISFSTMNNAIDTKKFSYDPNIGEACRKKQGMQDNFVIGHVGRFDSQKNHLFLLKIFNELIKIEPRSRLVLIGDGPLRNDIEKEIQKHSLKDKVTLLGVRTDVPALFQMMDVFVFPSLYEGLPVTLIEAQAAGLRTFASDTVTDEVVLTDLVEFLSIEETPLFWAEKIAKAIDKDKKDTKNLIIEGGYDIAANAKKAQEFYIRQLTT